ncbi:hypothetical protein, partial [Escherichia coli]|uniref:hypothetical protein n=1 Tax=Escherichia coli TaxID=562 RepID=UPI001BC89D2E
EKRVFLVILFTSFSGSLVSRIPGAVHKCISHTFVLGVFQSVKKFFATLASKNETGIIEMGCCAQLK